MTEVVSFEQVLNDSEQFSKRHLLLGNGFSIACCPDIFHYGSLLDQAEFNDREDLRGVFDAVGTQDFERAIRSLESAASVAPLYSDLGEDISSRMHSDAGVIKEVLLSTIAGNHPSIPSEIPDKAFWACRRFLLNFLGPNRKGHVFSLNYDLLLYWALMHEDVPFDDPLEVDKSDGFGNVEDEPGTDYVVWQGEIGAHAARVHYLHGALHLYDGGHDIQKFTWVRTSHRLIDQAREAINDNKFPLFVAEGVSKQKKAKIRHNAYLYQGLKQLTANAQTGSHCFFVHGHSLADNDSHILYRLGKGKFKKLYVSLFGDPDSETNQAVVKRARKLVALRHQNYPLELEFYDAQSADVWGEL